jgi:hypothetical protein
MRRNHFELIQQTPAIAIWMADQPAAEPATVARHNRLDVSPSSS